MPAAVLLRHQPALQLVGQPRHHRAEGGQLLVEQGAQPLQFARVAQLGGVDGLVEGRGEHPVGVDGATVVGGLLAVGQRPLVEVGPLVRGVALRFGRGAVRPALALLAGGLVVGRAVHRLALAAAGLVLFLVLIVGRVGLLVFGLVLAFVLGRVVALAVAGIEVERAQHRLQPAGEGGLVVGRLDEGVELRPGLALQFRADEVEQGPGAVRRAPAGQSLTRQQRRRLGQRHALGLARAQGPGLLQPGEQGGVEVGADAGQRAGADRLDAGLFHRLEHLRGLPVRGAQAGVQPLVVIGQTQRQPVGLAAQGGAFGAAGVAWRMR